MFDGFGFEHFKFAWEIFLGAIAGLIGLFVALWRYSVSTDRKRRAGNEQLKTDILKTIAIASKNVEDELHHKLSKHERGIKMNTERLDDGDKRMIRIEESIKRLPDQEDFLSMRDLIAQQNVSMETLAGGLRAVQKTSDMIHEALMAEAEANRAKLVEESLRKGKK